MKKVIYPILLGSIFLSGCGGKDTDPYPTSDTVHEDTTTSAPAPTDIGSLLPGFSYTAADTKVVFNPVTSELSLPTFTLFSGSTDGTAARTIDEASPANPVFDALNDIDGWSTTAPMNLDFKGLLSSTSPCTIYMHNEINGCTPNVFIIPLKITSTGDVLSPLSINSQDPIDFALMSSVNVKARVAQLETNQDSVRIEPVSPLPGKTLYLLAVTNGLEDSSNQPVGPSPMYEILKKLSDEVYNQIGYPSALASVRSVIQGTEPIALGAINFFNNSNSIPLISQDDIIYTHLFSTTDPVTPLNVLAHPQLISSSLATLPSMIPSSFVFGRTSGFYSIESLATAVENLAFSSYFADAQLIQGAISLPSYLGLPDSTQSLAEQGSAIQNAQWAPSTDVATALQTSVPYDRETITTSLNGTEVNLTQKVTYRFPFPKKQADEQVPVTVITPTGTKPAAGWPTVVMVHGITNDRGALLILASKLADACNITGLSVTPKCFASVMIDLPLHGVNSNSFIPVLDMAPLNSDALSALPASLQQVQERHFGITFNAAGTTAATRYYPMSAAPSSGSMFINLSNFQNTRDHMKQAVMDELNLLASLESMDIDMDPDNGPDLNKEEVYLVGHSLGAMVGLTTAAVANAGVRDDLPRIRASAYLNAGGQLTRLLENSPNPEYGATAIIAGLAQAGLVQNTKNYESYFNVFQAVIDSGDPINFAAQLKATGTPGYFMEIAGDGTPNSDDQVVPVDADNNPTAPYGNAQPAPLAGTEPLMAQAQAIMLGAGDYTQGTEGVYSGAGATAPKMVGVRFTAGQHSTVAFPQGAQEIGIFNDVVNHVSTFFSLNGTGIQITNQSSAVKQVVQ